MGKGWIRAGVGKGVCGGIPCTYAHACIHMLIHIRHHRESPKNQIGAAIYVKLSCLTCIHVHVHVYGDIFFAPVTL